MRCWRSCRRARVGHLGLQRDETTAVASQYYSKLPQDLADSFVLLIDPMLATGGSAVSALDMLVSRRCARRAFVCIVAAPEGLALVESTYPGVSIYTPVIDRGLEREEVHRARPWRFRRSAVRDDVDPLSCQAPRAAGARLGVPHSACALGSAVEHRLHTAGVGGSNPPARTITKVHSGYMGDGLFRRHG